MSIFKLVKKFAPELLAVIGVGMMVSSTVIAVKETPKAQNILEKEQSKRKEPLKKREKVKIYAKHYAPSIAMGVAGAGCIFGSCAYNIKLRKEADISLSAANSAFRAYRQHVINDENLGPEKDKEIVKKVVESTVKEKKEDISKAVDTSASGLEWIVEPITGDTWFGSRNDVDSGLNKFNSRMMVEMYGSLNELKYQWDRPSTELDTGWRVGDGLLDIDYELTVNKYGYPAWKMVYSRDPMTDYSKESY